MNKFGVHGLVWTGTWGAKECAYTVESSKEAGFDLVEFPVFSPDQMDIPAIVAALEANDMEATCSLGLGFDNDINSEDPGSVASTAYIGTPWWNRCSMRSTCPKPSGGATPRRGE